MIPPDLQHDDRCLWIEGVGADGERKKVGIVFLQVVHVLEPFPGAATGTLYFMSIAR